MNGPALRSSGVAALLEIGRPEPGDGREYVTALGLTDDDVPALVELAKRWADEESSEAISTSPAIWAPIHAWRALGELRADVVVPTLLAILDPLDGQGDDWFLEEFPPLCGRIGAPAVEVLVSYLRDSAHAEYARVAAAHGLQAIAAVEPGTRARVCEALADTLRPLSDEHPDLNAFLVSYLTDLEAVEHAELIERAFDEGVVSEMVCGEWGQVAFELGVGPRPPHRPSPLERMFAPPAVEASRRAHGTKTDKAARTRQRRARRKNRRR